MMRSRRALLALTIIVVSMLVWPTLAVAKSYTVDSVVIGANLASNGDLTIEEQRTLTFDGSFSRVFWTLGTAGSDGIEVLGVSDDNGAEYQRTDDPGSIEQRPPGYYYVEDTGGAVVVHAFHQSSDQQRAFTLSYRALGAGDRWADTSELYWKLIGDQSEVAISRFSAKVKVDGITSKEQMKGWAHGPLTGKVTINQDGSVSLTADSVPPSTFVEVRMAFPAETLSGVPPSSQPKLDEILEQERGWAEDANRQRSAAKRTVLIWNVLPAVAAVIALAYGIFAFMRYGKEYGAEFKGKYFREDPRPDLHPAVVGALWRFGSVADTEIAATLMDLADKGALRMSPTTEDKPGLAGVFGGTRQTYVLERADAGKQVSALDTELLDLLFGKVAAGKPTLVLSDIETYAKANAQTFSSAVAAWKASAEAEADKLGLFETESWSRQVGIFVLAAFVAGFSIAGIFMSGTGWSACVAMPVALALSVVGVYMRRRSRAGNELYRQYAAVRDYLKDFSRLDEAPPTSVILWNRFIVLAVVFGIAEQVIEQLRIKVPQVVADPAFQTSYWWAYSSGHGSPVHAVSSSFVSAASVAKSEMSSASGGGGGFSGGGGFGGGGGGFGAD